MSKCDVVESEESVLTPIIGNLLTVDPEIMSCNDGDE